MCVCMYVAYVCEYSWLNACMHVCTPVCVFIFMYSYVYIYTYVCMYVCIYIYTKMCECMYMRICVHAFLPCDTEGSLCLAVMTKRCEE